MLNLRVLKSLAIISICSAANAQPSWLSDGLIAHYRLDGDARDDGPSGIDGLARNTSVSPDRFGRPGGSLEFRPSARSRLSLSGLNLPTGYDPMTISFWFKIEEPSLPSDGGFTKYPILEVLSQGRSSWNFNFIHQGNGEEFLPVVERFVNPFPSFVGDYAYEDSFNDIDHALSWHQGILVCNGNSDSSFYVDGVPVAGRRGQFPNEETSFKDAGDLTVGYASVAPGGNYFSGDLDDLRIYSRALSENEVAQLFDYESKAPVSVDMWGEDGLVGFYSFDSQSTEVNGELNGSAVPAADRFGRPGSAVRFDPEQNTQISHRNLKLPQGDSARTVSLWLKPDALTAKQISDLAKFEDTWYGAFLLNWGNINDDRGIFLLNYTWERSEPISLVSISAQSELIVAKAFTEAWDFDSWNHLSFVYRPGRFYLYLNGEMIPLNTEIFGGDPQLFLNTQGLTLTIGNSSYDDSYGYFGLIDDIRIYDRALSTSEIRQLHEFELIPPDNNRNATAIAQIVNGFIVGAEVVDGGYGYTSNPEVTIVGGGGSGALATATVSAGQVVKINILNPGAGYTGDPIFKIAPPPVPPSAAFATAEVVNGFLVGAQMVTGGDGYTEPPAVRVTGGNGDGAVLVAEIEDGRVIALNVVNPGSGYTATPVLTIAPPPTAPELSIRVTQVEVNMKLTVGKRYTIESSKNTVDWTQTGALFTAEEEFIAVKFDVDDFGQFYRVIEQP